MSISEFLAMVQDELDTIKIKATQEEIAKLDFKTYKENDVHNDIYGQMTGHYDSDRAKEIYPKIFNQELRDSLGLLEEYTFEKTDYTPLEDYLYLTNVLQHENIIKYIKGEIDSIIL